MAGITTFTREYDNITNRNHKKALLSQRWPRDAPYIWTQNKGALFNIIYYLPLNSLFNSHCLPPFKMLKLYIVRHYVGLSLQLQDPRRYRWSAKAD